MLIKDLPDISLNVNTQISILTLWPPACCHDSRRLGRASSELTLILGSVRAFGPSGLSAELVVDWWEPPFPSWRERRAETAAPWNLHSNITIKELIQGHYYFSSLMYYWWWCFKAPTTLFNRRTRGSESRWRLLSHLCPLPPFAVKSFSRWQLNNQPCKTHCAGKQKLANFL